MLVFVFLLLLNICLGAFVPTQVIDNWEERGDPIILILDQPVPPSQQIQKIIQTNNAIGGERDIVIIAEEGSIGTVSAVVIHADIFNFAAPAFMSGTVKVQYDGIDQSLSIDPKGLNGIDLTVNGGDRFRISAECDIGAEILLKVYEGNRVETKRLEIDSLDGVKNYFVHFSQFENVDLTSVGAIELVIPFDKNLDIIIEKFDVVKEAPENNFEFVLEVDDEYINFELGCVERIDIDYQTYQATNPTYPTTFRFDSSTSMAPTLLPPLYEALCLIGLTLL